VVPLEGPTCSFLYGEVMFVHCENHTKQIVNTLFKKQAFWRST